MNEALTNAIFQKVAYRLTNRSLARTWLARNGFAPPCEVENQTELVLA